MHGDLYDYLHSMNPLYGPKEAAEEATEILMEAADLGRLGGAARVEPGPPSPPPDAEPDNIH